jgi:hypothetical protein
MDNAWLLLLLLCGYNGEFPVLKLDIARHGDDLEGSASHLYT